MSLHYYCVGEDNEKEESIDNYKDLFVEYLDNPPSLKEALNQIFTSGGVPENEINDYVKDITKKVNKLVEDRDREIKEKYPNISHEDSLIICSYTCEAINSEFSPYRTLNRNLASDNRKEGLKKVSKYLYILLKALRKLKKYYPDKEQKYLYRGISFKVNTMIDPYRPKLVPYLRNKQKCFWAFTSTSPLQSKAFDFLGDNGYHQEKKIKTGTFFSLYGKVWGYDISLFNSYDETEILLEPERKFRIENVISDANDIKVVTCEIIDSPIVLNDLKNKIVNSHFKIEMEFPLYQSQQQFYIENKIVIDIFVSVLCQLEEYIYRYANIEPDKKLSVYFKYNHNINNLKTESELFLSLANDLVSFEDKYFAFIEKYGYIELPQIFPSKKQVMKILYKFSHCMKKETKIQIIISSILELINGIKPDKYKLYELIDPEKKKTFYKNINKKGDLISPVSNTKNYQFSLNDKSLKDEELYFNSISKYSEEDLK